MEFVPGKAIDQLLETFGVLNVNTIRIYTRQLLSALKYLHKNGVVCELSFYVCLSCVHLNFIYTGLSPYVGFSCLQVHRDIKGKNILVDANGVCGCSRVCCV